MITKWLEEQNIDILGPWPGNSPDLNPIENLVVNPQGVGGQSFRGLMPYPLGHRALSLVKLEVFTQPDAK